MQNHQEVKEEKSSDPNGPEREPEKVLEALQTMMMKALKERFTVNNIQSDDLDPLIGLSMCQSTRKLTA